METFDLKGGKLVATASSDVKAEHTQMTLGAFSDRIINDLKENRPLMFQFNVNEDAARGFVNGSTQGITSSGDVIGGHMMLLTGVRTEMVGGHRIIKGFEITNSWGETTGLGGRFYLPVQKYLENGGSFIEATFH